MITSQPIRLHASAEADLGAARLSVPDGRAVSLLCWRCNDQKPRPLSQAHYSDPDLCEFCDEQMAHGDFIFARKFESVDHENIGNGIVTGIRFRIVERKDGVITVATDRDPLEAAAPEMLKTLQYVLDDEDNLLPRATSACRKVVRTVVEKVRGAA